MSANHPPVTIIAAVTLDNALGRQGQLLYRISADMRRFRHTTTGHTIIMGRKTFESFPAGPLPDRRNIVVTRNPAYHPEGTETYPDIETALEKAAEGSTHIYIIGGGEIYRQTLNLASRLDLTVINATCPDADTHFPTLDHNQWQTTSATPWETDPRTGVTYRFVTMTRIKPGN